MKMNVWAVCFEEDDFTEDKLYEAGLVLVDADSQTRIKRFYHKKDSYRCLLGRLLPRLLLAQHGVPPEEAAFGRTASGKPFVVSPAHVYPWSRAARRTDHPGGRSGLTSRTDNAYVVMAFQALGPAARAQPLGADAPAPDVERIGVDVMKVALPRYEKSVRSFVQSISDTLTALERRTLLALDGNGNGSGSGSGTAGSSARADDDAARAALRHLYLIWTLKEAYTKALGLGLGFDFRRIEIDVHACRVAVDGAAPRGWEFAAFALAGAPGEQYQVAVARFAGADADAPAAGHVDVRGTVDAATAAGWFVQHDAASLIARVAGAGRK
ncbi:hypothetical protein DFH11DRAFT_1775297 [Phellopilus nigrolimitatus]|nr:hypothetical protein DFH11DRAFT_1775297 [Phellopilus nigrolimitatus]